MRVNFFLVFPGSPANTKGTPHSTGKRKLLSEPPIQKFYIGRAHSPEFRVDFNLPERLLASILTSDSWGIQKRIVLASFRAVSLTDTVWSCPSHH